MVFGVNVSLVRVSEIETMMLTSASYSRILGVSLWRNWQTQMVANYRSASSCGFKSRRRHTGKLT